MFFKRKFNEASDTKAPTSKKYALLADDSVSWAGGPTLYRIQALRGFGSVKAGELGGYVESENNLSQQGRCWVRDGAWVFEAARVSENAQVHERAHVFGNAQVSGNVTVLACSQVYGIAEFHGYETIRGHVGGNFPPTWRQRLHNRASALRAMLRRPA